MTTTLQMTAAPEAAGVPAGAIDRLLARFEDAGLNTHSLLIARRRQLAFEGYWAPYTAQTPHRLYSVSKSLVSVAIGTMIDDGHLTLTDRLVDLLPEKVPAAGVHPYVEAMRVVDLLTMRTAHGLTSYKQVEDPDWVRTFFSVAPTRAPGTVFSYDTSASVVLTAVVEKLAGVPLVEYLRHRILNRIGIEGEVTAFVSPTGLTRAELAGRPTAREIERNPDGVTHGGSALFALPRDLLRFAQLCLDHGRWGEDQIVSEAYMRAATGYQASTSHLSPASPESRFGYGYQFWCDRNGGFSARGMGGQLALCLPEHELVVVTTADNQPIVGADQIVFDAVRTELLPALATQQPQIPRVASLALRPVATTEHSPDLEPVNAAWRLDEGRTDFTELRLEHTRERGQLTLITADGQAREFPFGLDSLVRGQLPGYGYETLSSAAWLDRQTFHLRVHVIGGYHAIIDLTLGIRDDVATLVMSRAAEMFANEYQGVVTGHRS